MTALLDFTVSEAFWVSTLWASVILLAGLWTVRADRGRRQHVARSTLSVARSTQHVAMHPLIYDWNPTDRPRPPVVLWTTRRCAMGCSRRRCAVRRSTRRSSILHLIDRLGIETANIGLPGAGPQVVA